MHLFYAPDITLPRYTLNEEESKHAVRVLRMVAGDSLSITDGRGNMHRAVIADPNPKRCQIEVVSTLENFEKLPYDLTIGVAPTKNTDRFEWFLEKATEIGVSRVVPLKCDHSVRGTLKLERGEKVIISAMKQSLKAYKPELTELTSFARLIAQPFEGVKLIAHCDEGDDMKKTIGECVRPGDKVMILIGPEGDFSPEEVRLALESGFTPISLGKSRLRTETAALFAVANVSIINL